MPTSKGWSPLRKSSAVLLFVLFAPLLASAQLVVGPEKQLADPELEILARAIDVDTASDGPTILVVWSDRRTDATSDIFAARLDRNGRVLDANIAVTSTPDIDESDPFVDFDGTRYLVTWFDGTNTLAAEISTAGVMVTPPTVIAAGRPTTVARGSRDAAVSLVDATGANIGVIRPGLEFTAAGRIRPNQHVRLVRVDSGYMIFFVEYVGSRAVLRAIRVDSRGRTTDTFNLGALGSFTNDLTIAAAIENGVPILAAFARDRMVVARVSVTGVITPLTVVESIATRTVEEIVTRTGGFDIVGIINGSPRIFRYASDVLTVETSPLAGPASAGAATLTAGRLFTVWQIEGVLTGRFAFSNTEPAIPISQSAPNQQMPALATDGVAALAVWVEDITETRDRIMARLITRDGTPISEKPLSIANRTMAPKTSPPAVALHGNSYYIAWVDARNGVDKPAQLIMRTVDRGGAVAGDIPVSSTVAPNDSPSLASGGSDALLVWAKAEPSPRVRAAFLSDLTRQFEIHELLREPVVAFGGGAYVIAGTTALGSIRAIRFLPDGTIAGTLFETVDSTASEPAIAYSGSDFFVVFKRAGSIVGRFVNSGLEVNINDFGDNPQVAWDGNAFVVAWTNNGDVFAARVLPAGTVEAPVVLSGTTLGEDFPALLGLGGGVTLTAYQRQVPELFNINRVFTKVVTTQTPAPTKPRKRRSVR